MPIDVENLTKTFGQVPVLSAITETFADGKISVFWARAGAERRRHCAVSRVSSGRAEVVSRSTAKPCTAIACRSSSGRQAQDRHGVSIVRDLAAHDRVPERQPSVAGIERRAIERKVNDALDLVDLRTMGLHSATQLSGGQQQRVALARCIVSGSPVILMDEQATWTPTCGSPCGQRSEIFSAGSRG